MRRFLEYDDFSGIMRWVDFDPATGMMTEYSYGDAQGAIDHATRLRNDPEHWKKGVKNNIAHYAYIPDIVLLKWHTMGVNLGNPDALVEMVNKPEWSYLKTTDKVVLARA